MTNGVGCSVEMLAGDEGDHGKLVDRKLHQASYGIRAYS